MITCERCGKEMSDTVAICPSCGTISSFSRPGMNTPTNYGQNPRPDYEQGYNQQQMYMPQPGYGQPYNVPPTVYSQVSVNVNMTPVTPTVTTGNSAALIVEVLLNLFMGIYGVGWLMAGETTIGIILLVCSILLYWPIIVLGTIFTLGIGLLCLGPLAIGALILNAVLLNSAIKRKTTYILMPPVQPMSPR